MAKPTIVTRATKGSALTWTEGDANLTNLQNATVSIKAGSAGVSVSSDLNSELTLVAGTNITLTGDNTAKTITVDATGGGATTLDGLSDVALGTPVTGEVLYFDGTNWIDTLISGLTAGVASTVTLTADNTTAATNYPLFVNAATGNLSPRTDTGFTYNPSTGILTSAGFAGPINGSIGATTPSSGSFTSGSFSGGLQITGGAVKINAQQELHFADSDSSNWVGFKAPATVSANKVWTLPAADGTNGQVLSTNGSGTLAWATAGGGGASFALASAQSGLYTDGTNKNIMWNENYDSANCLSINATTGQFTLTAGTYIVSLEGMGRIGTSQGNGLQFYNVTGAAILQDMGYSFPWNGGTTFMIPIGSFALTPGSSNTYVFRFTGNPTATSITSTVLNLKVIKLA